MTPRLVFGDEPICRWVTAQTSSTGLVGVQGNYRAIGVARGDKICAGFVYHNWNPGAGTIEMTIAAVPGSRWANRETIHQLLAYAFIGNQCQRITTIIDEDNFESLRLSDGIGFKRESIAERCAPGGKNLVITRLFVEEWRAGKFYLGGVPDGQAETATAH
jgi:RimJ/RimL family protein N-acetyltransferase